MSRPLTNKRRIRLWVPLLMLAAQAAVLWPFFLDEPLQPVGDIMPQRPEMAWDDQNGWKRLDDFVSGLPPLDKIQQSHVRRWIDAEKEPLPAAARGFALTAPQLSALEEIAAMPHFQAQQRKDFPLPKSVAAVEQLRLRIHISILLALEENNIPLTLRLWTLCGVLQRKITPGAGSESALLDALILTDPAMAARSLTRVAWNDAALKELAESLKEDPLTAGDALEAASHDFKSYYEYMIHVGPAIPGFACLSEAGFPQSVFYQKNRTANHYAAQMRVWRETVDVVTKEERLRRMKECASSFPRWFDPNWSGTSLIRGYQGSSYNVWRAGRRSIQVLIALHRSFIAHGSLPATLNELVPKFLPAVPDDPCVLPSQPLRWDAVNRAVCNSGDADTRPSSRQTRTHLISDDHRSFYFRTKAEEDARREGTP